MRAAHQLLLQTVFGLVLFLGWSQTGLVGAATVDRFPAVPLAVKSPYLSSWTYGPYIGQSYTKFWNGADNSLTLLVRLNNTIFRFAPSTGIGWQTGLKVTPTQSIFQFTIGPVVLTYNFYTPIDAGDLKRLSLPVSYVAVSAQSTDNRIYPLQIFVGWWGEWAAGERNSENFRWNAEQWGSLFDLNMEQQNPKPLSENNNGPLWGSFHAFTNGIGTTFGIYGITSLEQTFSKEGRLNNSIDSNFRPINTDFPSIGFAKDIFAGPSPSPNVFFGISRVARPAINTIQGPIPQLWEDFFKGNEKDMIQFAFQDAEDALLRCQALDAKILVQAAQEGGDTYSKLVSAALRQAYGAIELVGTQYNPMAFIKDMSVSGSCQRTDLIYANMPVHLYLNPKILKYLLDPLLVYQETGHFTQQYAASDLGAAYPQCIGGYDRDMGVEQSANMMIMIDAYVRASNDRTFGLEHYNICKKWAEYLVANGLRPGYTLSSDDVLFYVNNSTNLALKAIVGIGAMADLAQILGKTDDYLRYRSIAQGYIGQWLILAQEQGSSYIKFSYDDRSADSWVLLYNMYPDVLLGTNLIPNEVVVQQQLWHLSQAEKYGIPLRNGVTFTKVDSLLLTAAASPSRALRKIIYDRLALFLNDDTSYSPFRDIFGSSTASVFSGYKNRPNVGAVFAPLTSNLKIRFSDEDLL